MGTQVEDLATRFENVSGALISTIEGLDDADLTRTCAAENCTVAALATHLAGVYAVQADWVGKILSGESLPDITMDDIHRHNAENAATNADLSKDEVLGRLRSSRDGLTAVLRGLADGDPDRVVAFSLFPNGQTDVKTLVELVVNTHTEEHLASVQKAVGS